MKKIVSLILALAVVLCALPFGTITVNAETSGIYTYTVSNGEATITGCSTSIRGSVIIPSTLGGYPVTNIGRRAFYNCYSLTSITFPDGLTGIDSWAFEDCNSMISVTIPDSITSISQGVFYGCSSLNNVTIPDSVKSIGNSAFYFCSSLTSITIPDSVTSIAESAFGWCQKLIEITISDSVTSIAPGAFYYTGYYNDSNNWENNVLYIGNHLIEAKKSLSGKYTIKQGTKKIANSAFSSCSSLTLVTIPDGVTGIGSSAFKDCSSLTSLTIPDSVTSIGGSAFYNCSSLTSLTIPDSVTSIGGSAFYNCSSLTSVEIGNSVTSISSSTFYNCSSLISITIPDNVTSIGQSAFRGCSSLESITLPFVGNTLNGTSNTHFGYIFGTSTYSNNSSYVPSSLKEVTITKATSIPANAFYGCSNIEKIILPDTVTSIGYNAFYGTTFIINTDNYTDGVLYSGNHIIKVDTSKFGKLTVKDGIKTIAPNAFENCDLITSVVMSDSLVDIGANAFKNCTSLTSVTIPDSVKSIGDAAFYGCSALKKVNITDLADWCNIDFYDYDSNPLYYAKNLYINGNLATDIEIPDGVRRIKQFAFYNYPLITSVSIPESVKFINKKAFYYCKALTRVDITDLAAWCNMELEGYEANPLYYAKNLYINGKLATDIVIPDSVEKIKNYVFYNCINLKTVQIPEGVTRINACAFTGCSNLASINIPDSLTGIGPQAFAGCTNIEDVYVNSVSKWLSLSFEETYSSPLQYSGARLLVDNVFLGSLELPRDIETVGVNQFIGCNSIKNVFIPKNVLLINKNAFDHCKNLQNVYYEGTEEEWEEIAILAGNDKILNANIFFNSESIPVAVESVEIAKLPTKTEYIQNREALDLTGGVLTVYYDNGTTQNVYLSTLNVTGFDNSVLGEQTLSVKYNDFTVEFTVNIIERPAEFIALLDVPEKLKYNFGESLNLAGGEIVAGYSDGIFEFISITSDMVNGFEGGAGFKTLTVSYGGKQTKFSVFVYRNPDLDGNGTVSATDVAVLKKSILSLSKQEDHDLNVDGSVNVLDLVYMKKVVS